MSQSHNEKPLGQTSIPITVFKGHVYFLSRPLSLIIYQSFAEGAFANILKILQAKPIGKKLL